MAVGTVRSPGLVLLFSIITCGIYHVYWYFATLSEMAAADHSPTGNSPWLDFLIAVVTLGIYGMYVDYRIGKEIIEMQAERNLRENDTSVLAVALDLFGLGVVATALQQNELNRIWGARASQPTV
ncbi:MAG TPA: DUF4234 domain-containing protein [Chloroflexota bacterium]|jgi:hypothetical protein